MPAEGGEPERLTWHPAADVVQGWTPEGDILFRSGRDGVPTQLWKFYTVGPEGGLPTPLALPQAYLGGMSADGPTSPTRRSATGTPSGATTAGARPNLWASSPRRPGNGSRPLGRGAPDGSGVWMDGVVYYLSERDWASNVWSFDPSTGTERQVTRHADFDAKSLGAGDGVVVYEQAGYLHELDPGTGATRQLVIDVTGDMNWSRARWEAVPAAQLRDARLSPQRQAGALRMARRALQRASRGWILAQSDPQPRGGRPARRVVAGRFEHRLVQ